MSIEVKDFRGAPEPSEAEIAKLESLRAADERARLEAAAQRHRHLYRVDIKCPIAKLNSGPSIPVVGLGTWKSQKGEVKAAVEEAVRAGYRHIDAAAVYGNEEEVGAGLSQVFSEGVVSRGDLFITSKLWNSDHGRDRARSACLKTLKDLQVSYLDLYLIHWPVTGRPGPEVTPPLAETWSCLEGLVEEGLVRSIGVSNFSIEKTERLIRGAKIKPAVLQVEAHPYWRNQALFDWATSQGIHVTAYSPLGSPDSAGIVKRREDCPVLLQDNTVAGIAERIGKNAGQVLIRWAVQRGTSVLPKSVNPSRIRSNLDVFDWELTQEDFEALSSLEPQMRMVPGDFWIDPKNGPYKTLADLWDE